MKIAENYSIIIIPKDRAKVRRWNVSRGRVRALLGCIFGFVFFLAVLSVGLFYYHNAYRATIQLREDGAKYEIEKSRLVSRLEELAGIVEDNEKLASRLESIIGLDKSKGVTVGALSKELKNFPAKLKLASVNPSSFPASADLFDETTLRAYNLKSIDLVEDAKDVGKRLKDIYQFSPHAEFFWTSLPTFAPVKGWMTSDFGMRRSPTTGRHQFHEGIDIASPYGVSVIASGDGVVIFSGRYGGLGNKIVIDHGFGVASVYGHNSQLLVRVGERVKRGEVIARVGTSGRSTGPHLHYEVLLHGVPIDPHRFLLAELTQKP